MPEISSRPPRQIVIYRSGKIPDLNDQKDELVFAAVTTYANMASKDHAATIFDEFLRVTVSAPDKNDKAKRQILRKVQLWVYEAGNSDSPHGFQFDRDKRAVPFVVAGQSAFAHEVLFIPYFGTSRCFAGDQGCVGAVTAYSWDDFQKDIQLGADALTVELGEGVVGLPEPPTPVSCTLQVADFVDKLRDPNTEWAAPECLAASPESQT